MTEELGVESESVENSAVESDAPDGVAVAAVSEGESSADEADTHQASAANTDVPTESADIVFMMAACTDPSARPELAEFARVEPRHISSARVSFYCNDAPTRDSIVLLMGKLSENPIYVSANVTSCSEGFWERKRRYLVGCELTGRL